MPPSDVANATMSVSRLTLGNPAPARPMASERARRALNVVVAAVGLLLAAPLMGLIALAVWITSDGPVFYRQTRIGLDRRGGLGGNYRRKRDLGGKPFTIIKFRTMRTDARAARQEWASPDDPRVTSVGRVLRRYRLDELPQLLNVLRGEMNVVGPRPEQPKIFADLRSQVPGYSLRQRVRPGITGWAQINHHYDVTLEDVRQKVAYDLEYLRRSSFAHDLRIMLQTVPTMVLKRGGW
jgi:lipopolysaccharide/colanic/teichoic acid biosynthesis glycosyltransferase